MTAIPLRLAGMTVIPLRLAGGAFQLLAQNRCSLLSVRSALFATLALEQFAAYNAFSARKLPSSESSNVSLSELLRLAALFEPASDRILVRIRRWITSIGQTNK